MSENKSMADRAEAILDSLVKAKGGIRREKQVALARSMAYVAEKKQVATIEGDTGVGKSFAAIATALATGKPTLISTHTHALQQQLEGDLAMLAEIVDFSYSTLKGRSAYFCHERGLRAIERDRVAPETREVVEAWLEDIENGEVKDTGDRATIPAEIPNSDWTRLSATSEQCIGSNCPFAEQCFYLNAKALAATTDITVVNHALVSTGLKGEGEFLEGVHRNIIIDECHEFPSVLGETFGADVSSFKLENFAREASNEKILLAVGALESLLSSKSKYSTSFDYSEASRRKGLLIDDDMVRYVLQIHTELTKEYDIHKNDKDSPLGKTAARLLKDIETFLAGDTRDTVTWLDYTKADRSSFSIRAAMYNVGRVVRTNLLPRFDTTQFLSATIRVNGSFDTFARRLGLKKGTYRSTSTGPIFDYENHGMIWLPESMRDVQDPEQTTQVAHVAAHVASAAGGRTLVLCTSWKAVDTIYGVLEQVFENHPTIKVIRQKRGQNIRIAAERFREEQNTILVGTRTLWTGVSFDGDTNLAVVVDKLPFPHPDDPIIRARNAEADADGRGWFMGVSVPDATLTMVQGIGRLIRTVNDRGIAVICDPRVNPQSPYFKQYGSKIIASLPPMTQTFDTATAMSFLREAGQAADARLQEGNPIEAEDVVEEDVAENEGLPAK